MSEIVLLSPKVDFIFKKIFGNEKKPEILISFLNAVLQEEYPITSVEIKNSDIEKEHIEDKYSRLDIKATTNRGELFNVEIQIKNEKNMTQRSLYYWSRMYTSQLSKGDDYNLLKRTVCINILDFKHIENSEDYHNSYRIKNTKTNNDLTDLLELHFIELPKCNNCNENSDLEVWLEFIKNPMSKIVRKKEEKDIVLRKATDELINISGNSEDIEKYRAREDSILEKNSALSSAKRDGITIGREEGKKEGREEGKKQEKIKNIKSILDILDDEIISKKFDIDILEVKKLREEI